MEITTMNETATRRTQADRRATTRGALLEAAARGLSTYGYANLVLEQVARDAGYSRGALYHLFANKEELALAVVAWVNDTWDAEVRQPALRQEAPLASLITMAEGHVSYCRDARSEGRVHRAGPSGRARDGRDLRPARDRMRQAGRRWSPRRLHPSGAAVPADRSRSPRHPRVGRNRGRRQDPS